MKDLNRLKVVLIEQKRTKKWLAEQLDRNVATVSKWCNNRCQPDLHTINQIAESLYVDLKELIQSTK